MVGCYEQLLPLSNLELHLAGHWSGQALLQQLIKTLHGFARVRVASAPHAWPLRVGKGKFLMLPRHGSPGGSAVRGHRDRWPRRETRTNWPTRMVHASWPRHVACVGWPSVVCPASCRCCHRWRDLERRVEIGAGPTATERDLLGLAKQVDSLGDLIAWSPVARVHTD